MCCIQMTSTQICSSPKNTLFDSITSAYAIHFESHVTLIISSYSSIVFFICYTQIFVRPNSTVKFDVVYNILLTDLDEFLRNYRI